MFLYFLLTIQWKGSLFRFIEAMATGNIIVTTDHAGIPDVVSHDNGYLIKPRDINDLVDNLENISKFSS